uniref:Uncharacterized protein n=1 Tax=Glossina palpalis gambiensis TaxID=67801 RepID=A0A1B0BIJ8_9MUSC
MLKEQKIDNALDQDDLGKLYTVYFLIVVVNIYIRTCIRSRSYQNLNSNGHHSQLMRIRKSTEKEEDFHCENLWFNCFINKQMYGICSEAFHKIQLGLQRKQVSLISNTTSSLITAKIAIVRF